MDLRAKLQGAVIMAPMTKGSNLPYRRLCDELGADITMGEMALARKLQKGSRAEFALIARAPSEGCFGVQLAGRSPEELGWAAALAEERGADLVDLNCGCPIEEMTRRGLGAALLQKPNRIRTLVEAMKGAVTGIPVTVKIRLGWNEERLNYLKVAQAAVDGGADALVVHGRSRAARYTKSASWERVGEVVEAVSVPVVGNGDLLFPHEIAEARRISGCAAVMIARGALIKPWIFREAREGYREISAEERLEIYRRFVALALEHWGSEERGRRQVRTFLLWHIDHWTRYAPRRPDGSFPRMQEREDHIDTSSPLDELLTRSDPEAHAWLADLLLDGEEAAGPPPPAPEGSAQRGREPIPEG